MAPNSQSQETPLDARFRFGDNWRSFLNKLTTERIRSAEQSLTARLGSLEGRRFLDVGSGSGLFSLAARNRGANVVSFDYDPSSVQCTQTLRDSFYPGDELWQVFRGSALDADMLETLGLFDVVYSWGVLHHTGDMWRALKNMPGLVSQGGQLYLSIYNDQGGKSLRWKAFKRLYIRCPGWLQSLACLTHVAYWEARMFLIHLVRFQNPFRSQLKSDRGRGMDFWHDIRDWLGGYPFEVAKPEEIFDFYSAQGFRLTHLKTCAGGHGCNEFVFRKD